MAVLGLPVAPLHPYGVHDGAIGDDVAFDPQLWNQYQLFPVIAAVGVEAVLEGRPDVQFIVRPTKLNQFLELGIVVLYVRVAWHTTLSMYG